MTWRTAKMICHPLSRAFSAIGTMTDTACMMCPVPESFLSRAQRWLLRSLLVASLVGLPLAAGAVTFNFTGTEQTYTLPAGASGVLIQAAGAGGAGGGADAQGTAAVGAGVGGSGGTGVTASGTYLTVSGTQLKVYVGGGGTGGVTSSFGFTCANSAGAAGSAGGVNGYAGGPGALPGCGGYSGGGGGGGGASVVSTSAGTPIFVAGGGGGGQGGSWESFAVAPSTINPLGTQPPGSAGAVGVSPGAGDGGGGGGGGGGCQGGVGGSLHNDKSGTANGTASTKGGSCAASGVTGFAILGVAGGSGGAGAPANPGATSNPPGTSGGNGSVILTPVFPTLNVVKAQPIPALTAGTSSAYTITVSNTGAYPANSARVLDQLPFNVSYVSSSGTGWACTSAPNASGTLVTCNFTGTIAATNGTSALQLTVTPTTNASVTNYASVDPTGAANPPAPTTCTAANAPSAGCAAPVVSGVTVAVSGTVYRDANHNANFEGGETGVGGTRFVKLAPRTGSTCSSPATASASVNAATGAYRLPAVAQGNYCLILDDNATLSDISPALPAGTIGTENGGGIIQFSVTPIVPSPQDFGFYTGSRFSGVVFADTGAGSGSPNNGIRDGTEPGLSGVSVRATSGATTLDSGVTAADGSYLLWLPASASGIVVITPSAPSGYLATGGLAGTSGGSYTRPSVSVTPVAGQSSSGVNFGLVPPNRLSPNGAQTAQPGNPVFYAHVFQAGSGGQVTFSLVNSATPVAPAWSQVLYRDSNCNGVLDPAEAAVSAAVTVTAGQSLCLIVKQFVPTGAVQGAQNTSTLTAAFSYSGAAPALAASQSVTDITTIGQAGALVLSKLVSNLTPAPPITAPTPPATSVDASPGHTLQYTLNAVNNGTESLLTLIISDATPAFTTYVSASCPASLPAGVTACAVSVQPAVGGQGGLQWTFGGTFAPGAQLVVSYQVKVNQ